MKANIAQKIAFVVFAAALALLIGGVLYTTFTSWWGLTACGSMTVCYVVCRKSNEIGDFVKRTVADIRDNWGLAMAPPKAEA